MVELRNQKTVKGTPKKLKRPNIRSYKNNRELYDQDRKAYNAQSAENKTKVGKQGRPKKNKDIKEATNVIKNGKTKNQTTRKDYQDEIL